MLWGAFYQLLEVRARSRLGAYHQRSARPLITAILSTAHLRWCMPTEVHACGSLYFAEALVHVNQCMDALPRLFVTVPACMDAKHGIVGVREQLQRPARCGFVHHKEPRHCSLSIEP